VGGPVNAILIDNDGKPLIGGEFGGQSFGQRSFARLGANGLDELSFSPTLWFDYDQLDRGIPTVNGMALQPDGKIVLVGRFNQVGGRIGYGTARNGIVRFNADSSLDRTFRPGFGIETNARNWFGTDISARSVALQADGKIIVGGKFTNINGNVSMNLARIKENGSFDESFRVGSGPNGEVRAIAFQADGNILIGGVFSEVNGVARGRMIGQAEAGAIETVFLKAYRWQYIHSGAGHPQFGKVLTSLITDAQGLTTSVTVADVVSGRRVANDFFTSTTTFQPFR
jgi:uncharacterized delta-60 repeat protein